MSKKEVLAEGGFANLVGDILTWGNDSFASKDVATPSANGLMSATDKAKLDQFTLGYETVDGVSYITLFEEE